MRATSNYHHQDFRTNPTTTPSRQDTHSSQPSQIHYPSHNNVPSRRIRHQQQPSYSSSDGNSNIHYPYDGMTTITMYNNNNNTEMDPSTYNHRMTMMNHPANEQHGGNFYSGTIQQHQTFASNPSLPYGNTASTGFSNSSQYLRQQHQYNEGYGYQPSSSTGDNIYPVTESNWNGTDGLISSSQDYFGYDGGGGGGNHHSSIALENVPAIDAIEYEAGSYYPLSNIEPETTSGAPVTAIAYDDVHSAMYIATVSNEFTIGNNFTDSTHRISRPGNGSSQHSYRNGRSTMMVAYDTMYGSLYSSVQSHPEAEPVTIIKLYESIYKINVSDMSKKAPNSIPTRVPNHAYKPPYGDISPDGIPAYPTSKNCYQIGVTSMIPLPGQSNVLSVSPAAVRMHTIGGLQVADFEIEGMVCATMNSTANGMIGSSDSYVAVGGLPTTTGMENYNESLTRKPHIHYLDIWQGLRPVSSFSLSNSSSSSAYATDYDKIAVTTIVASNSRGCIVAGASDGFIRLLDSRLGLREVAKMKGHSGGVVNAAISEDGTLIATTGYVSSGSGQTRDSNLGLHAFPDTSVLVYDIRYMGRGGIPHPFTGLRGGPRYVSFITNTVDDQWSNRILVASGQTGGGLQIIAPFQQDTVSMTKSSFIIPVLDRFATISAMCVSEDNLALGTSNGMVIRYKLAGYDPQSSPSLSSNNLSTNHGMFIPSSTNPTSIRVASGESSVSTLSRNASSRSSYTVEKQPLKLPSLFPPAPALSLPPTLLLCEDPDVRPGDTDKLKSIFTSYILASDPTLTVRDNADNNTIGVSFGPLASDPMISQISLSASSVLLQKATQSVDFLKTIPTSCLNIDLFENHRNNGSSRPISRSSTQTINLFHNPNKMIYTRKLFDIVYGESINRSKRYENKSAKSRGHAMSVDSFEEETNSIEIPARYRVKLRPSNLSPSSFNYSDFNSSGLLPGWDYPALMPNAFVSPVLMLLFCLPEFQSTVMDFQFSRSALGGRDISLVAELGYLFHRIDMVTKSALVFPTDNRTSKPTKVGAWAPTSFISVLTTMAEAEQLQILDGSPAAVAPPRRPEAFYRFLLYRIDKEIGNGTSKPVETLCGIEFVSVNEYLSGTGPQTKKMTKQLTLDFNYQSVMKDGKISEDNPYFGDLLQRSISRATELGAWNQVSKSYDTIIQRKILTSLPTVLSLSPECAGCKVNEGLALWRSDRGDGSMWLPEQIELEIEDNGGVIVRERLVDSVSGSISWREFRNKESFPDTVSKVVAELKSSRGPKKRKYRLEAVMSMVRDDMDRQCPEELRWGAGDTLFGHHVLHVRTSVDMQIAIVKKQIGELDKCLSLPISEDISKMTLLGRNVDKDILRKRRQDALNLLASLDKQPKDSTRWTLMNGFVVTDTVDEDARGFHVGFKEPSLIIFRAMEDGERRISLIPKDRKQTNSMVPWDVIRTVSITNGSWSNYAANQKPSTLPNSGEIVAFDAEFVSVQEEESVLTLSGSKVTIRETRHAIARISVINAQTGSIVFDDYVQPNEPVSDYLTRFSGIHHEDLNPQTSIHHLITSRGAYLKLRCLVERGCIFVGHGLCQDFWTANIAVPLYQIVDTLDIYHKPAQRFISLRFLTNFVLHRDMQQDLHDSVEDGQAALELYQHALELKRRGEFEKLLDRLYECGQRTDWKLGIDGETESKS